MRVLVTDGDSRAGLAIVRSLGRAGYEVVVGEKSSPSLGQSSRFCSSAVVYPDPALAPEDFVDYLAAVVVDRAVDVLIPVADIPMLLVTAQRGRFAPCVVPFAEAAVVERAADKVNILETAASLGVPVPQSVVVEDPAAIPDFAFECPVVVKPRRSRVWTPAGWVATAVSYANDRSALARDLAARRRHEFPLLVQERIKGPGVGVFALYDRGRAIALFSHRRLRERPPSGGVSVLSESVPLPAKATEYATRLLDEIKWHGAAMVEFKHDLRDDTPKLMEINGRFWGSLQLAVDAGVDFPSLLLEGVRTNKPLPPEAYRVGVRNRWFWGDVDSLLLTLFSSTASTSRSGAAKVRAVREFLKLWGRDLHYENPTFRDIKPGLLETYRWVVDGLGQLTKHRPRRTSRADTRPTAPHVQKPSRGGVTVRAVSSLDEVGIDERAWNELVARSDTNSVFQTHQWMRSWLATFGTQCEPMFIVASNRSGVAAIAPLAIEQSSSRNRVVRFIGDGRADYCDVLAADEKATLLPAVLEALRAYGRWDVLELNNVPSHSRTVEMLRGYCRQTGCRLLVEDQFACPRLLIEGHEASARSILNKPSLRRSQNYFQRVGRLERRNLTTAAEIEPYLEPFFSQHVRRWRGTASSSLFLNPRNQAFYRSLTRNMSETGWLLFSVIELDGVPIAFHYGFDYHGTVLWYKPSFDIAYSAHSPGMVMVRHLLDYAINQNRRELDFTVGDEPFKRRFTNDKRKTVRVQIFRESARYVAERSRRAVVGAMKKTFDMVRPNPENTERVAAQ